MGNSSAGDNVSRHGCSGDALVDPEDRGGVIRL